MTKAQQKRLETILAKLEALQGEVKNDRVREYLSDGKTDLIRALRAAGR